MNYLHAVAVLSIIVAIVCSFIITLDINLGHPQHMWIMNIVWPVTALYLGPIALIGYYKIGRLSTQQAFDAARERGVEPASKEKPFWLSVALAATHCGSGCTLGDLVAEWFIFFFPFTLFGRKIFAAWSVDYIAAFLFGIAFQYFRKTYQILKRSLI